MAAVLEPALSHLAIDPTLTNSMIESVGSAMGMCGLPTRCVGVTSVPSSFGGEVTGMIGVHGKVSGFLTVSVGTRLAIRAVEGLLQDKYETLTSQVVDGVGEITNIIVGGIKSILAPTRWSFGQITVPSVIVGKGYNVTYGRGLTFVAAIFEHQDPEAIMLEDRLLQVSMSLLPL